MDLRIRYSIGFRVGLATGAGWGAFVASHCAALVVRCGGGLAIASATAIEISGRYFLATAGHCLAGLDQDRDLHIVPPMSAHQQGLPFRDRGSNRVRGDEDLGWIELDATVALASGLRFFGSDTLRPTRSCGHDQRVLVHGLPSQLASRRSNERGHRLHLRALGLFSRTLGHPEGDAELRIKYDHGQVGPHAEGLRQLPAAHGMSGGGVWQLGVRGEMPRLAGLVRAWHRGERELRGVPIERWLHWLGSCLPELRSPLATVLAPETGTIRPISTSGGAGAANAHGPRTQHGDGTT